MFAPIRALLSPRAGDATPLVAGAVSVALIFGATPFLIPLVSERYGISVGTAGLISAAQVSGFALTTFVAGRWWRPSRFWLVGAALVGAVFHAASALSGSFGLLLLLRLMAGSTAGVFTWLAWASAMRDANSMRTVSAIGPVSVLFGAPLLAWIGSVGGAAGLYWALAASPLPVLVFRPVFPSTPPAGRRRMSPSRSNLVLLAALGVLTLAGSALFVFLGAFAADEIGMGSVAVAIGFSINAGAGLVGARWRTRPRHAWPWIAAAAICATSLVAVPVQATYYLAMMGWGFAWWMAIPRVLLSVAEWSLVPDERVGDAQTLMAVGRALGPVAGGALIGPGSFIALGVLAGIGHATAATLVGLVERYRVGRPRPNA